MKKIFIILILIASVYNHNYEVNATSNCRLYIKDATKYINSEKVTIDICMENIDTRIVTLGLDVKYDTSKMEFVSSKAGKDLNATIKLAEDINEENRVAIGAISTEGFKNNGIYYSVTFKILDSSKDIPIEISLREANDKNGNDINVELTNGIIKMSKEEGMIEESTQNQKIAEFEINNFNENDDLENIIKEKGKIEIVPTETFTYEIEDNKVLEVLDGGEIVPGSNGTTNIRVKLNNEPIGNIKIEVNNGKVQKLTAADEVLDFKVATKAQNKMQEDSNEEINSNTENNLINNEKNVEEKKAYIAYIIIAIFIITVIIALVLYIKNRKGEKYEK